MAPSSNELTRPLSAAGSADDGIVPWSNKQASRLTSDTCRMGVRGTVIDLGHGRQHAVDLDGDTEARRCRTALAGFRLAEAVFAAGDIDTVGIRVVAETGNAIVPGGIGVRHQLDSSGFVACDHLGVGDDVAAGIPDESDEGF